MMNITQITFSFLAAIMLQCSCAQVLFADENIKDLDDFDQETAQNELNRLNAVRVSQTPYAVQLTFDFNRPIYYEKTLDEENRRLSMSFPGMRLQHFDKKQVLKAFDKLKQLNYVENIDIFEQNTNFPKVVVSIEFKRTRRVEQPDGSFKQIKNGLVVKLCKLEDPNLLIFDIFTEESLKKLKGQENPILHAFNKDSSGREESEKIRVILDAGHGGEASGAQCHGLTEKILTLDIARRTQNLLNENGLTALLTRDSDQDISLTERVELAHQLKANLFVSIHINSAGPAGSDPSGLETYYLDTHNLLPPSRSCSFLFVNLAKNMDYITTVDKQLQDNADLSKKLASTIQQNIITVLQSQTKYPKIINRGVKPELFRIFFNNQKPTTLVEVGFITNENEARLLANGDYQNLIASGICNGIMKYIRSHRASLLSKGPIIS